jgi:hypothetical protein
MMTMMQVATRWKPLPKWQTSWRLKLQPIEKDTDDFYQRQALEEQQEE